jgi:Protein kinase domain/Protein kinase C terminal domain
MQRNAQVSNGTSQILMLGANCVTECGLTCHAQCAHLVPDFCGMSMIVANEILETIQRTKNHNKSSSVSSGMSGRTLRPGSGRPGLQSPTMSFQSDSSSQSTLVMKQSPDDLGQPPRNPSVAALSAAQNIYSQPSPQQQQQQRPPQVRATSVTAVQAAAAASGMRPPSQVYDRAQSDYTSQRPPDRFANARPPQPEAPPSQHASYDPRAYHNYANNQYSQPQQVISPQQSPVQPLYSTAMQNAPLDYSRPTNPSAAVPSKLITTVSQQQQAAAKQEPMSTASSGKGPRIGLDHFNFLAVLGKGNFGKVMLAETKSSKKLYAIKVLKKEFIIENDEVESTKSEKRVFLIANKERHPFLLNLHACFQTETRVYFVMEYISGGDLMLHIQRGQFGLKRAQFYAAEVCLALKYFHENGVIYRDLKLDNILLTLDGHIKIGDYGLCKEEMWYGSTTSTFCGTPEFMAPEILLDKKYGRAVDWWAFGVLIYQMLLQQSPFRGEDEDEIYDAILADEPLYPIHMPRDSVSILQKLLTREPDARLGSGPTDAQEIMSHPFFKGVNWEDIYHKRVPAPFKPTVKNEKDTSNFDQEFTSVTPVLTPVQSGMCYLKRKMSDRLI